jgi:dipeptidase E
VGKEVLLLSTSTIHGSTFLQYCISEVEAHFKGIDKILFVPYARPSGISYEEYTSIVQGVLEPLGKKVVGIHELENKKAALSDFKGIYIGGGNTFLLTKALYENDLIASIKDLVEDGSLKYMGSSAGTNVAGLTINNTNDMPITYPPSFEAMGLVPFNINPHYLDPDPNSTHKGETRETRINEYHFQSKIPVVGLREGSSLKLINGHLSLGGDKTARIFQAGKEPIELSAKEDFNFLLKSV